ncbi:MAG: MFS transporter, partial [Actinobacteria bacterium]|nr:MFS transporter [Actinomycetota bacterium]
FEPARRGKPLGIWAAVTQLGTVTGPLLGGVLATQLSWRLIFWVDVPLLLLAIMLMYVSTVESRSEVAHGDIDWTGASMLALSPAMLVVGIHLGGTRGWTSPLTLVLIAGGLAVASLFPYVERRISRPLIDVQRFAKPAFLGAVLVAAIMYFIYLGVMYFQSLYMLNVLGLSAARAGLGLVAMTGTTAVVSLAIGFVIDRYGHYVPIAAGMAALSISLFWQARVEPGESLGNLIAPLMLLGLGLGLVFAPSQRAAVNAVAVSAQGTANGIVAMARQLGGALGIGLLSAVFITALGKDVTPGEETPQEFISALQSTLTLAAGLAAVGLLVAVVYLRPRGKG